MILHARCNAKLKTVLFVLMMKQEKVERRNLWITLGSGAEIQRYSS